MTPNDPMKRSYLALLGLPNETGIRIQELLFDYGFRWSGGKTVVKDAASIILDSTTKYPMWSPSITVEKVCSESSMVTKDNTQWIPCGWALPDQVIAWTECWLKEHGFKNQNITAEEIMAATIKAEMLPETTATKEMTEMELKELQQKQQREEEESVKMPMIEPTLPAAAQPTATNPYDAMVEDITNRVIQRLPKQDIDEQKVQQIVNEIISKQGRLMITIADNRRQPPVIKDINEPVHCKMPDVIGILKSRCWCCAVGPTGSGKTLGALQYAKVADVKIVCIKQMTRIIAPHDLVGFMDANGKYRSGAWTDAILGYHHDNAIGDIPSAHKDDEALIIIDEMDNSNENIVMLVKALQTGYIQMPYGLQKINPNLYVMATMNTWGTGATREYVGRMTQDAALLNEFSFVEWDYDDEFEETLLLNLFDSYKETAHYKRDHMFKLHSMFKAMRQKAEQQKVRVIISTRNIINVTKKLLDNPQWSVDKILHMDVYKGLKPEDIKRVEAPEMLGVKKPAPPANAVPSQKKANNPPVVGSGSEIPF